MDDIESLGLLKMDFLGVESHDEQLLINQSLVSQ